MESQRPTGSLSGTLQRGPSGTPGRLENDGQAGFCIRPEETATGYQASPSRVQREIGSQVLQDVIERLDKAFQAFLRRVKSGETPGYPRFKSRRCYRELLDTWPASSNPIESSTGQPCQTSRDRAKYPEPEDLNRMVEKAALEIQASSLYGGPVTGATQATGWPSHSLRRLPNPALSGCR